MSLCLCSIAVTVTALPPTRLCRIAVFLVKPTLLSLYGSSWERHRSKQLAQTWPQPPRLASQCVTPCDEILQTVSTPGVNPGAENLPSGRFGLIQCNRVLLHKVRTFEMDQGEGGRNQSHMFDTGYTDDYAARCKALLRQSQTHRGEMTELIEVLAHEL